MIAPEQNDSMPAPKNEREPTSLQHLSRKNEEK